MRDLFALPDIVGKSNCLPSATTRLITEPEQGLTRPRAPRTNPGCAGKEILRG